MGDEHDSLTGHAFQLNSGGVMETGAVAFRFRETTLFPLFDELQRTAQLPYTLSFIMPIVLIIQNIGATLWLGTKTIWGDEVPEFLNILYYFCSWGLHDHKFSECVPQLVIIFLTIGLVLLFLVYLYFDYKSRKLFSQWQLYFVNFVVNDLLPILLVPTGCAIGKMILQVNNNPSAGNWVGLLLMLSVVCAIDLLEYYSTMLICYSVYFHRALFQMRENNLFMCIAIELQYLACMSIWVDILPRWMTIMFVFIGIAFMLYALYRLYFLPMIIFWTNGIMISLVVYAMCNSVSAIIRMFTSFPVLYYVLVPGIIGVVSIGLSYAWVSFRVGKIRDVLSPPENEELSDEEKVARFDSIVFSSKSDLICYLRVAFAKGYPYMLDLSFIRYTLTNYCTLDIIFTCMRMISCFRFDQKILNNCLRAVGTLNKLNLSRQFQLYEMRKLNSSRQSGSYFDDNSFASIGKKAEESISMIRGFWIEILRSKKDISFATLRSIRRETQTIDTMLFDALEQCPMSPTLNNMYVNYMIEAEANYSSAVRFAKRIQLVNQGKQVITDYAFRSLVTAYPHYLHDRILTINGTLYTHAESLGDMTDPSYTQTSSSSTAGDVELDAHCDDVANDMIDHGRLRIAIQNSLAHQTFRSNRGIMLLAITEVILAIIFTYVVLVLTPAICADTVTAVTSNCNLGKLSTEVQYASLITAVQTAIQSGDFGGMQYVLDTLHLPESALPTGISSLVDPYKALYQTALNIQEYLDIENRAIMDHIEQGWIETEIMYMHRHNVNITKITGESDDVKINVSIRSGVVYFIEEAIRIASHDGDCHDCKAKLYSLGGIIELLLRELHIELSAQELGKNGKEDMIRSIVTVITVVVLPVLWLLFGMALYDVYKEVKAVSIVLRSVSEEAVNKSFRRIHLNQGRENVFITTSSGAPPASPVIMYVMPILFILTGIGAVVLLDLGALAYADHIDFVRQIVVLARYSAFRMMSVTSKLINIFHVLDNMYTYGEEDKFTWDDTIDYNTYTNKYSMILRDSFKDFYFGSKGGSRANDYSSHIKSNALMNNIDLYLHYLDIIERNLEVDGKDVFKSPIFCSVLYIFDTELFPGMLEYDDMLVSEAFDNYDHVDERCKILCISSIFVAMIGMLAIYVYAGAMKSGFDAFKQLIQLLPATYVAKDPVIHEFVIGDDSEYRRSGMEAVVESSVYAALNVDPNLVIQTVSQGLATITGFTPDQTLGQPLSWLIPEHGKNQEEFYTLLKTLTFDRDSSGSSIISCMTESGQAIQVHASLVAQFNDLKVPTMFSILLRDLTEDLDRRKRLRRVVKRTNQLLQNLVPIDLDSIPNIAEAPIYSSEHAVIVVIELIGIYGYVHTTSARDMMSMIEACFAKLDDVTKKYPGVHTLNRWSGVYLGVCGLFHDVEKRVDQATQIVRFCIDAVTEIEEVNMRLATDIHLTLGVHSGGPVVGTFSDSKSPNFDLVSDVRFLAEAMKDRAEPDKIQISSPVKELLGDGFVFEEAGTLADSDGSQQQIWYVRNK